MSDARHHRLTVLSALVVGACTPVLTSPAGTSGSDWVAPENSWPAADSVPADLVGEGYAEGQVIPDFRLQDQFRDEVSAWQFYGMVVALDVSTIWCGPCGALADEVDETWKDYEDEGFIYVTLLSQDSNGEVPDQDDLAFWADEHGITAPILSDDAGVSLQITPEAAFPQVAIVGRDLRVEVARVNPVEDSTIRAAIEDAL